jgi:DNA-binding transcriptional MerR regulator
MADIGFSTAQTAFAANRTLRETSYWARADLVRPSVANPSGRGYLRKWSVPDVHSVAIIGALRDRGVSLQSLRVVQRFLRECDGLELQDVKARLVLAPGDSRYAQDVAIYHSDAEVISLLTRPGQQIAHVVVDVGALLKEVTGRLDAIRDERAERIAASKQKRAEKEKRRALRVKKRGPATLEEGEPLQKLERSA